MIDVLIADDEAPARAELAHLLRGDARIGEILTAASGSEAVAVLSTRAVAVAFLDIHMPGLDGLALAAALQGLASPPVVVFVTADDARAVDAFDVRAADYLLKPVRIERLRRAVDRAVELVRDAAGTATEPGTAETGDEVLPVTVGSAVRFVRRSEVRWVHAQGDYSRLHVDDGPGHLVRVPISELEERWAPHGFVRVHRSYLAAVAAVVEARLTGADPAIVVGGAGADAQGGDSRGVLPVVLPVSRRMLPGVREALVPTPGRGR